MLILVMIICAVTFAITFQNSRDNKEGKYHKQLEVISGIAFWVFLVYVLTVFFVDFEEVKEKVSEEKVIKVEGNYVNSSGDQTSYFEKVGETVEQKVIPSESVIIEDGKEGEESITTYIVKPKSKIVRAFNWGLSEKEYEYIIKIPLKGE